MTGIFALILICGAIAGFVKLIQKIAQDEKKSSSLVIGHEDVKMGSLDYRRKNSIVMNYLIENKWYSLNNN